MDAKVVERFLIALEKQTRKDGKSDELEKVLNAPIRVEKPGKVFLGTLGHIIEELEELQENPLARIAHSPGKNFKNGLLLGYLLACASTDSALLEKLTELEGLTASNITPITAAKGFGQ